MKLQQENVDTDTFDLMEMDIFPIMRSSHLDATVLLEGTAFFAFNFECVAPRALVPFGPGSNPNNWSIFKWKWPYDNLKKKSLLA